MILFLDGIRKCHFICNKFKDETYCSLYVCGTNKHIFHLFVNFRIVASWLKNRNNTDDANDLLLLLFDRYVPPLLDVHKKFKKITPIPEISLVQMTCHLLDCLLTPDNLPKNCPKDWYEIYFVFAAIWGFGSSLFEDQQIDWRIEFSKFWIHEYQSIQFPDNNNACVFDYYVDKNTKQFKLWEDLVPKYEIDSDIPLQV